MLIYCYEDIFYVIRVKYFLKNPQSFKCRLTQLDFKDHLNEILSAYLNSKIPKKQKKIKSLCKVVPQRRVHY